MIRQIIVNICRWEDK